MADITSSETKTFFTDEIFWAIAPIKKLLIEMDLSGQLLFFLKGLILLFKITLKLFETFLLIV